MRCITNDDHQILLTYTRPRLALGTVHLEYGFPSTHTANSISIALFLYSHIHRLYFHDSSISSTSYYSYLTAIILYAFSIVFGRIYAGMHSFTDCISGVIIGAVIWALQHLYLERIGEAVVNGGWIGKSRKPAFSQAVTRHISITMMQCSPCLCDLDLLTHGESTSPTRRRLPMF